MLYTHHLSYTSQLLCDDMGILLPHMTEGNRPREANSLLSGEAHTQKLVVWQAHALKLHLVLPLHAVRSSSLGGLLPAPALTGRQRKVSEYTLFLLLFHPLSSLSPSYLRTFFSFLG